MNYENRVQELKDEGIPAGEARRLALQEQRMFRITRAEEDRRDARLAQSKVRMWLSIFKFVFK